MIVKIRAHGIYLAAVKKGVERWKLSAATKSELLRFVADLDVGKVNPGHRISEGGQYWGDLRRRPLWRGRSLTLPPFSDLSP